jgi:hypothetical protein
VLEAVTEKFELAVVLAIVTLIACEPVANCGTITSVLNSPSPSVAGTGAGLESTPPIVNALTVEKALKPAPVNVTIVPAGPEANEALKDAVGTECETVLVTVVADPPDGV